MKDATTPQLIHSSFHQLVGFLPRILSGIIIFFIIYVIARVIKSLMTRLSLRDPNQQYLLGIFARVVKISIIVIGGVSALGTMGVNVAALVASLGLVGFALGYALKDALANTLAGIMILFYRPFTVDDEIRVSGLSGRVAAIDLRYTQLMSTSQERALIPNSTLMTSPIEILPCHSAGHDQ